MLTDTPAVAPAVHALYNGGSRRVIGATV